MAICKAALLAAVLGLAIQAAQAQTTRPRLIVFGDALADDGTGARLYAENATGNANLVYPPTPYYQGRFSNGMVIPEYLAQYLNLQLFDFAISGATSGATSSFFTIQNNTAGVPNSFSTPRNIGVPSVYAQVTNYVNLTTGNISPNDYYALIVGTNDYLDILANANATTTDVINYIRMSAVALYNSGVRKLVIAEVPPLQGTPYAVATNATLGTATKLQALVTAHNSALSTMVRNLTTTYPSGTFAIIPVYTIVANIATNPTRYGYTNSGTQCYGTVDQPVPSGAGTECATPSTHIFWDRLYPTTYVHQQIAAVAAKEISTTTGAPAMAPAGQAPVPAPAGLIAG